MLMGFPTGAESNRTAGTVSPETLMPNQVQLQPHSPPRMQAQAHISETEEIPLPWRCPQLAPLHGAQALESMCFLFSTLFKGLDLTEFSSCHNLSQAMANDLLALLPASLPQVSSQPTFVNSTPMILAFSKEC